MSKSSPDFPLRVPPRKDHAVIEPPNLARQASRPTHQRHARSRHRMVRAKRPEKHQARLASKNLELRFCRLHEVKAGIGHADDATGLRRECRLEHPAQRRVRRDRRLLRHHLLVHLPGFHARPGADLQRRQRSGEAPGGAVAERRRRVRLRPVGAGTRRGHLFVRHAPGAAGGWRLCGERQQILHRQRQRGGAGIDFRQEQRDRRLRVLRGRLETPRTTSA